MTAELRIARLDVRPFVMRRRDTEWRTAAYAASSVDACLVEIHTDGGPSGIGAATVMRVTGDTPASVAATLCEVFAPLLQGQDPFAIEPLLRRLKRASGSTYSALAAIDLALHDLKGKALGVPVYQLLGGAFHTQVPVIRMVGLKAPAAQAADAARFVAEGYRHLKLKIGRDLPTEVRSVAAVRQAVGDDVVLTVDANGAYTVKNAIQLIRQLETFGVTLVEDPVPYADLDGLARVTAAVDASVMADLSITTPADAIDVIRRHAADLISVKIFKVGGILNALKIRHIAEAAGMACHLGSTATTRAIEAGSVHFAAASADVSFACEIGEFADLDGDVVTGLDVENGHVRVPQAPGLGVTIAP